MSDLIRVIVHWTGGTHKANNIDRKHYHVLIEGDGNVVAGKTSPEDNIVTSDGRYAAHTLRLNTGSIGVAMCGMYSAKERPFQPGPYPLTRVQVKSCAREVAKLCKQYGIPVSNLTVLTHAEVQPNLGVKQKGKWDITRLLFRPDLVGPAAVGNYFRSLVAEELEPLSRPVPPVPAPPKTHADFVSAIMGLLAKLFGGKS